ncbi:MAG: SDR family NAD(P)-dependent oxidoreductase [Clostridia bacterium]|nr:SDR family NAD(P)-dependent oxidoreductase [Clostridia bacterium]
MKADKWITKYTESLDGKRIAISGSTGGIGKELCRFLLKLGASLVLIDRSQSRSDNLIKILKSEYENSEIEQIIADMEDINSVKLACTQLESMEIYGLILNAGAYSIPRHKCSTGYDNVFQINFVSPYYMARRLENHVQKIVAVGSIAHNYSHIKEDDIDFSGEKKSSLVYGNAKRYLMYSLLGAFENHPEKLAIAHPGITFTGITNHYPKLIFAIIKHPMKVIFMKPRTACLSILMGLFRHTEKSNWIGPRIFDIWGMPKKKPLKTASENEQKFICETAEEIFRKL